MARVASCFAALLAAACSATPDATLDEEAERAEHALAVGQKARVEGTGGAGLRLRSGAGSSFSILAVMPEGATVDVIGGPDGAWYKVSYAGKKGWCSGAFLEPVATGDPTNRLPWTAGHAHQVTQGHNGGSHTGAGAWAWDFGLPAGTPVLAAHYGTVRRVKGNSNVGGCWSGFANDANYVVLDQGNGAESLYLHLGSVAVAVGDWLDRGDLVGHSGQTGWSCGPHLHFQVQIAPSSSTATWYGQSIHDFFHDTGVAKDPAVFTWPVSANAAGGSTPQSVAGDWELEPGGDLAGELHVDPHGGAGVEWDEVMRRVSLD